MPTEVLHSPLAEHDIDELADALHHEAVYRYIGGLPSREEFELWLRRAMAGPPDRASGERWLSFTARRAGTGEVVGRLEATVHDQLAEVAFLYRPDMWGRGLASQGLAWLHGELRRHAGIHSLWATTHPDNRRSASLLLRHGYQPMEPSALPVLHSYEAGDLVFSRGVT